MSTPKSNGVFRHDFLVPESSVDYNGHVNNVVYVQWMQDVAQMHSRSKDGPAVMNDLAATWVARAHKIEYLRPAFTGEALTVFTWVEEFRRVRCFRRYIFLRGQDEALAKGTTEWVFIDLQTSRPRQIPEEIQRLFPPVSKEEWPPGAIRTSTWA